MKTYLYVFMTLTFFGLGVKNHTNIVYKENIIKLNTLHIPIKVENVQNLRKLKTSSYYGHALNAYGMRKLVQQKAAQYELEEDQLGCVLYIESSFRLKIVSKTGDYGIGQINKRYWKFDFARLLTDVEYSVDRAAYVLGYYKQLFGHESRTWYMRYNIGPSNRALSEGYKYLERFYTCYENYYNREDNTALYDVLN